MRGFLRCYARDQWLTLSRWGKKKRNEMKKAQYLGHSVVSDFLQHLETTVRDLIEGIQIERTGTAASSTVSSGGRVRLLRLPLDKSWTVSCSSSSLSPGYPMDCEIRVSMDRILWS